MAKSYLQLNDTIATFVDEHNSLVNKVGDLANLATTGDSDLTQAINEIHNSDSDNRSLIDSADTKLTTAWGLIDSADTKLTTAWGLIDSADTKLTTAWGLIDSADTKLTTAWGLIDSADTKLTTAWGLIDSADTKLSSVQLVADSAQSRIDGLITERTAFPSNFIPDADGGRNLGADGTRWNSTYHDYARVTNNIHTGNGSVISPAFAFEGDTNTGLYKDSDNVIKASGGGSAQFDLAGVRGATKTIGDTFVTSINPSFQVLDSLNFRARSKTALIHATTTFYNASGATFIYAYLRCNGSNSQTQIGSVGTVSSSGADNIHPVHMLTNLTPGTNYLIQLYVSKSASVTLKTYGTIAVFT